MPDPVPGTREEVCPLCGGPNGCGLAAGATECWCFSVEIPAAVLDRIPPGSRNASCICQKCASSAVFEATPTESAKR